MGSLQRGKGASSAPEFCLVSSCANNSHWNEIKPQDSDNNSSDFLEELNDLCTTPFVKADYEWHKESSLMLIPSENLGLTTNAKPLGQLTLHSSGVLALIIPDLSAELKGRTQLSNHPEVRCHQRLQLGVKH